MKLILEMLFSSSCLFQTKNMLIALIIFVKRLNFKHLMLKSKFSYLNSNRYFLEKIKIKKSSKDQKRKNMLISFYVLLI